MTQSVLGDLDVLAGLGVKKKASDAEKHASRLASGLETVIGATGRAARDVLKYVLADQALAGQYGKGSIRYVTACGRVADLLLDGMGDQSERFNMMAIGDVEVPDFAREWHAELVEDSLAQMADLYKASGMRYDVAGKGPNEVRENVVQLFDQHYGFSGESGLMDTVIENSSLENGGMGALFRTALGHSEKAREQGKIARFVQPDNTFDTYLRIVKTISAGQPAAVWILPTKQENKLHLTADDVREFYDQNQVMNSGVDVYSNMWTLTPVSNPGGTVIEPKQLREVLETIVELDPEALILLDIVYMRTLVPERSRELFEGIIKNEVVRKRVHCVDGFSKTHAFPAARAGFMFSFNPEVFVPIQKQNMSFNAGISIYTAALMNAIALRGLQLGEMLAGDDDNYDMPAKIHQFQARERLGLKKYLLESAQFEGLFHENQTHIRYEDLINPAGLYLLPRLAEGVDANDVILATKCLGVETALGFQGRDKYMRFSVGLIGQEKFFVL